MTVTRRRFLAVSSALVAEASLAPGCASRRTVVRGACHHDCPDGCSWLTTVEDGRVVGFEGDPDHPFTRGRLCARMSGYPDDVVFSAERVLHPLRRTGKKGEGSSSGSPGTTPSGKSRVGCRRSSSEHGPTAVLPYSYAGTEGQIQGRVARAAASSRGWAPRACSGTSAAARHTRA